jgi:hypothetical protein
MSSHVGWADWFISTNNCVMPGTNGQQKDHDAHGLGPSAG